MKIGDLVRVNYEDERGFGPPCIFLGYSDSIHPNPEWMKLVDPSGRRFESHIDYIYPVSLKKEWSDLIDPEGRRDESR